MSLKIDKISARIILDSRQADTIEVEIIASGVAGKGSVPSGKSKGVHEAKSLLAQDAVKKIEELNNILSGKSFNSPIDLEKELITMDGTANKKNLGSNVILGIGIAAWRAFATQEGKPLYEIIKQTVDSKPSFPVCLYNLINGGLHAKGSLPFQEYLLVPQTNSPERSLQNCLSFIEDLKTVIVQNSLEQKFGDEGGFIVPSDDPETGLKFFAEAVKMRKYEVRFSLDVAASSLPEIYTNDKLISIYKSFIGKYNLFSIEDPFREDDFEAFTEFTAWAGSKLWVIGDDLTATNIARIKDAYNKSSINTVLIKPNQIGSTAETIEAVMLCKKYGYKTVVSHRSGETYDDFIADLSYALGADGLKSGSPLQEERLAKYRRLIQIEREVLNK